jgi:hypothetical protein
VGDHLLAHRVEDVVLLGLRREHAVEGEGVSVQFYLVVRVLHCPVLAPRPDPDQHLDGVPVLRLLLIHLTVYFKYKPSTRSTSIIALFTHLFRLY